MSTLLLPKRLVVALLFAGAGSVFAQTQLLPELAGGRGGGIMRSCNTSLEVGINTTFGNYYSCSFQAEVTPGNTTIESMIWSCYYNNEFVQWPGPSLDLTYSDQQPYPVCLTVNAFDLEALQPCSTTVCDIITPLPDASCASLQAAFGIASVNGNTIVFQNNSTFDGTISQAFWSFGDGQAIAASTPEHQFVGTGPFEVCLTVVGPAPAFCTNTLCQYLYLGPGNVECPLLVQHGFLLLQSENFVGVLDTSTTSGMDSRIDWDFGDGALAEGTVAVHTYPYAGDFQLCGRLRAWGPLLADTCVFDLCKPVTTYALTGLDELGGSIGYASPNPFHDRLRVAAPIGAATEVCVFDVRGLQVYRALVSGPTEIDLAHLLPGVYSVRVLHAKTSRALRVVKD